MLVTPSPRLSATREDLLQRLDIVELQTLPDASDGLIDDALALV